MDGRQAQSTGELGPRNTSPEWQVHPGRVAVWGVGSCEQHSVHLPLDTDGILADHFAAALARGLGAARLPTQRLATSLEQTGFRGTVSLRPETLMAVVRDVADEVERQGFRRLVIVNAHGGNHCLVPAVRDINRRDRTLKILLLNFWEHADPALAREAGGEALLAHAEGFETSLMLAIAPETVRGGRSDFDPAGGTVPLRPSDLTTFGVGFLSPQGSGGRPTRASREMGARLVASIEAGLLAFAQDRLRRLDEQPRYCGAGGIALRAMSLADLPDAMRLVATAGWNQTEADWRVFLADPERCFAAVHDGRIAGTAAGIDYDGAVSWIGMVLVDPAFRRMGIATRLMERTMAGLAGCRCLRLDATPDGKKVYDQLGFRDEFRIRRLTCAAGPTVDETSDARPLAAADLPALTALDAEAMGAPRGALLAALHRSAPDSAWALERSGALVAAVLGRPGARFHQLGPVWAGSPGDARAVLAAALRGLTGRPVIIDVPEAQGELLAWLGRLGLVEQRHFIRQVRGSPPPGRPDLWAAIAGPEFG